MSERKLLSWVQINTSMWCFCLMAARLQKLAMRMRKSWSWWKHGVPIYFLVVLLEINESLTWWIKVLALVLRYEILPLFWLTKLTSGQSDVANVDLGVYSDVPMIMKQSRTHLFTISCASHRLELLLKDAVKDLP